MPDVIAPLDAGAGTSTPDASTTQAQPSTPAPSPGAAGPAAFGTPGYQPPQAPPQAAPAPTLASKHPVLFNMLQGLTLGVDAFSKSAATHGREGGVGEVQQYQAEQQRQQIQKQQADREMQESGLRMEALRANMATNSFKLEQDRANAPLERQKLWNDVEEQKATFIEHMAKIEGVSPIVVKYTMGDTTEQTVGAVNTAAQENNTNIHNLTYAHTQTDGKPGQGGQIVAMDLKSFGSKPIPAELADTFMVPIKQTIAIGAGVLPADSPNLKQAQALANTLETGVKTGSVSLDQGALIQNKIEMLVHGPIAAQQAITDFKEKQAQAVKTQQEADPVFKMSQAEELAKPGAQASIQAMVKDPNTKPTDVPRLQALLPLAQKAQQHAIDLDRMKTEAEEKAKEGDPTALGQSLAAGAFAPSQVASARSMSKPFYSKMLEAANAAAKANGAPELMVNGKPTGKYYDGAVAEANFAKAKNPTTLSTLDMVDALQKPGGVADILIQKGKDLPSLHVPVFSSMAQALAYQLGGKSVPAYMPAAMDFADMYSKVMGGGTGSDTGRTQALNLVLGAQNPAQREAAVQTLQETMQQRGSSMVRDNPFLRNIYPGLASNAQTSTAPKVVPNGATPGRDAKGNIIGYKTADGKVVTF